MSSLRRFIFPPEAAGVLAAFSEIKKQAGNACFSAYGVVGAAAPEVGDVEGFIKEFSTFSPRI